MYIVLALEKYIYDLFYNNVSEQRKTVKFIK
jgi:hypothetical protein